MLGIRFSFSSSCLRVSNLKNFSVYYDRDFIKLKETMGFIFFMMFEMLPGKGTVYMNMWMMTCKESIVVRSILTALARYMLRSRV